MLRGSVWTGCTCWVATAASAAARVHSYVVTMGPSRRRFHAFCMRRFAHGSKLLRMLLARARAGWVGAASARGGSRGHNMRSEKKEEKLKFDSAVARHLRCDAAREFVLVHRELLTSEQPHQNILRRFEQVRARVSVVCPRRRVLAVPEGRPWSATCSEPTQTGPAAREREIRSEFSRRAARWTVWVLLVLCRIRPWELRRACINGCVHAIAAHWILLDIQCQCSRFIAGFDFLCQSA